MTKLEAIEAVESAAKELALVDPDGEPLLAMEVLGLVAAHHGEVWEEVGQHFLRGTVDAETYAGACCQLITEYKSARFHRVIERRLLALRADQRELGLVS